MVRERVVLGSTGDDAAVRELARRLRDEGREVVYVGGDQSAEQLVRTAIAEDATTIVVDGDEESVGRVATVCAELHAGDVVVTPAVEPSYAPRSPR